ncbi:Methyltransferase [Hexamita inflata]|uniref:Methyltransferase n=1 Tax=Hexamita inflata TaxID=28002 RepID=A0AA86QKY5_9EUKA|nr:Methyltransferase [Hexamita inflata]CAI9933255.1 Methyltransferase [Hexamita inflata]CAI9958432.1 Methyltransferase [Hexamita inflata]CAI9968713.1 Methyltransferase [Hexamita inflata]
MSSYHLPEYWDERYKNDTEPFEWYQRYCDFKPKLKDLFAPQSKVLMIGTGSSEVPFELYDDQELQIKEITAVDCSQTVIKRMQGLVGDRKQLEFVIMDCTDLTFSEGQFDVVFDKATVDSILCGEGAGERAEKMFEGICKVLKNQGVYLCISYGKPDMRMQYLQNEKLAWDVEYREIPRPKLMEGQAEGDVHYCYICRKRGEVVEDKKAGKKK